MKLRDDLIAVVDEQTRVIVLEVARAQVVLMQGFFENYEGLGCVRTLSAESSLVAVYTTKDLVDDAIQALVEIAGLIPWRQVPLPEGTDLMSFSS